MRVACVYAPQIPLQAVLRRSPELRVAGEAIVLADGPSDRGRIVALTAGAHQAGARPGMTTSQARAVAAGHLAAGKKLTVLTASASDTAAAEAALVDLGHAFAPRVEARGARVFFEVGDLQQLYPAGERAIAQAIAAAAARLGLAVRVAIASGKAVARVAAQAEDVAIVRQGDERAQLAAVSIRTALAASGAENDELVEKIERWGVRTLGALASLPRGEVTVRLGDAGARLHRIACGADDEPLVAQLPADALEEGTEIDYPVHELEPLSFILRGLIDRALSRLTARSLGCAAVTMRLALETKGFDVREVPLGAPTRDPTTLLQLARLELGRRPPAAAVVGIALLVRPARVRAVQLDFLRPAGPAPERLAATLARLAALVGIENVGSPAVVDSHREETVELRPYVPPDGAPGDHVPASDGGLSLGFRRFRPPHEVEVLMGRDGPTALHGGDTTARILLAAGPYHADGEWWVNDGWSRDYWDVHASDGAVYRVHQDRRDGRWYLDGYYD